MVTVQNRYKTDEYLGWLHRIFPEYITAPMADRHKELWRWIDAIEKGKRPRSFVAIWCRGGAKSTTAELGVIRLASKRVRNYGWYVSSTQDKADMHVESVGGMLESPRLASYDPELSERLVGKYGASKGWRRNRLRTRSGFTVDALGLDTGARGAKVDQYRPDFIILDDVDEKEDSVATTLKKIRTITMTILPAGSNDCAVLFIQNLVHCDSVASRLVDGRADFLSDRILSGPWPAVENLETEQIDGKFAITGGKATWEGQNLEVCQGQIVLWGYTAFKQEAQHDVDSLGGLWEHIEFQRIEFADLPNFDRTSVWVDPAVTSKESSDCQAISVGGVAKGVMYGLYWSEYIDTPLNVVKRAIRKALEWHSTTVGIETDQGGDTWGVVYDKALEEIQEEWKENTQKVLEEKYAAEPEEKKRVKLIEDELASLWEKTIWPKFTYDKAGAGYGSKVERNQRILPDYERGKVKHLTGTNVVIEKALKRFPKEPLDVADSWFWVWNDLMGGGYVSLYHTVA